MFNPKSEVRIQLNDLTMWPWQKEEIEKFREKLKAKKLKQLQEEEDDSLINEPLYFEEDEPQLH